MEEAEPFLLFLERNGENSPTQVFGVAQQKVRFISAGALFPFVCSCSLDKLEVVRMDRVVCFLKWKRVEEHLCVCIRVWG